jgi:hypothetical protein
MVGLYYVIPEMGSFPMSVARNFCDLPLPKYLDSKTVLIYCPHPVFGRKTRKGQTKYYRLNIKIMKLCRGWGGGVDAFPQLAQNPKCRRIMLGSNPGIVAMFVLAVMRSKSLGLISFTKEKLIHIFSNFEVYFVSPFNSKSASSCNALSNFFLCGLEWP